MNDKLATEQPIEYFNKTHDRSLQVQHNLPSIQVALPQTILKPKTPNSNILVSSQNHLQIKQTLLEQLKAQNNQLKIANKQLMRKLQNFEKRLDQSLKKHKSEHVKQKINQQIVESMELKNAYKMCEIYKRQISFLRKKQTLNRESKIDQLNQIIAQLEKDKQKLIDEVKDLRKLNRQQDKGLRDMVGPNFVKLLSQNQNLKDQIRIMQQRSSANESKNSYIPRKFEEQKGKKGASYQTNNQLIKVLKNEGQNKQIDQIQHLKNKVLKDNRKISMLMSQNSRLRQNVQELRSQMIQKDKQFYQLRSKLLNNNKREERELSIKRKRMETQPKMPKQKQYDLKQQKKVRHRQQTQLRYHKKMKSQVYTMQIAQPPKQAPKQNSRVLSLPISQYPRILEIGEKDVENYRWNHQQFSSKIKEVQVSRHFKGHVMELNFRYFNGQPKKISKNPYATFCCEENSDEYIICIRGGFKTGLLRYISLQTSKGRKSNFCQYDLKNQCINFQFRPKEKEYLGAFFGQNSSEGITRLGCYVEQDKQMKQTE